MRYFFVLAFSPIYCPCGSPFGTGFSSIHRPSVRLLLSPPRVEVERSPSLRRCPSSSDDETANERGKREREGERRTAEREERHGLVCVRVRAHGALTRSIGDE